MHGAWSLIENLQVKMENSELEIGKKLSNWLLIYVAIKKNYRSLAESSVQGLTWLMFYQ